MAVWFSTIKELLAKYADELQGKILIDPSNPIASDVCSEIVFQNQKFEINAVKAEVVQLNGEQVLKVERDLKALPFDAKNLAATVDEPTFVKLKNVNLENGIIEVKIE